MKSNLTKSIAAMSVALALGACASLPGAQERVTFDKLSSIHAGLTQDQVRSLAGAPEYTGSNPRTHETQWTYEYRDEWGYRSEFGVDFDQASGLVAETSNQRLDTR
jgi:outer membrane protein assembly factor BamE (lipoprotein component of BamABCDE complex)